MHNNPGKSENHWGSSVRDSLLGECILVMEINCTATNGCFGLENESHCSIQKQSKRQKWNKNSMDVSEKCQKTIVINKMI
jgi:hypothetical protein